LNSEAPQIASVLAPARRRVRYWIGNVVPRLGSRRLSYKQYSELDWWRAELPRFLDWYEGRLADLWGFPSPAPGAKITGYPALANALLTFADATRSKYPEELRVAADHFTGKKILDVGCGPIPFALGFVGCDVVGLDPLLTEYRRLGFPVDRYPDRITYVCGGAEDIPKPSAFFDAVISVNAIDHVDDPAAAAREITRVLRPGGVVRLHVHYHRSTTCEPHALDDDAVVHLFGHLGVRKIDERPVAPGEQVLGLDEKLTVWAND
jgi:SAM-dependent methyltransferase